MGDPDRRVQTPERVRRFALAVVQVEVQPRVVVACADGQIGVLGEAVRVRRVDAPASGVRVHVERVGVRGLELVPILPALPPVSVLELVRLARAAHRHRLAIDQQRRNASIVLQMSDQRVSVVRRLGLVVRDSGGEDVTPELPIGL